MTIRKASPLHRIHRVAHEPAELAQREVRPEEGEVASHSPLPRNPAPVEGTAMSAVARAVVGPSLGDYVELPFLYWRSIVGWLLASSMAGLLALIVWPRAYESEAKLMITVGRESVGLDPTATTSPTLMLQKTQEEEVNSALEILSSRQVAELVVDQLTVGPILDGSLPTEGEPSESVGLADRLKGTVLFARSLVDQTLLTIGVKDPVSDRETAIRKVMQSVYIYAPKRSTAITIHAESKTPQMAQALAAAVTNGFLDRHQSVNFNKGSREFFLEQTRAIEAQVNQALTERANFMQSSKVVSTEDQRRMLTDQMGFAQRDVLVTRGELEQALAEIEDLISKASTTTAEIVATKEEKSDETWSGMRQRVYELEIQEQSYASMYSEDNPKLVNARQQLEGARQILQDLDKDRTNRMLTPNPVKLRIEEDLQRQQTKLVGLRSMLTEKEKQRTELSQQVDELLNFELKLKAMDRDIGLLETSLGAMKTKLEEARVIDELQAEHISNVSIYQPATLVERPVSPQKSMIVAAFPLLGLMVGFGLALLREMGCKALRTSRQVEHSVGRPVLASLPFQPHLSYNRSAPGGQTTPLLPSSQLHAILAEIMVATANMAQGRGRMIGVVGVDANCGASTLAVALSQVSSRELGLRTLLINADTPGNLDGEVQDRDSSTARPGPSVREENLQAEHCQVIDMGDAQHRRLLRFDIGETSSELREYQADHDLILIDLPPANRPDRFSSAARHVDYVLVVIESDKTETLAATRLIRRLEASGVAIGVALNKTRQRVPRLLSGFVS